MARRVSRLERLARKEEKSTVKRIVYLSIISIVLAIFLFKLAIPILGNFADFLDNIFKKKGETTAVSKSVPNAPRLDNLPEATNSVKLVVSGFSQDAQKVAIYVDNNKVDETTVADGKFKDENITLKKGENKISAKSINASGQESVSSDSQSVVLDQEEPKLEISTPSDGQSFSGDNRIKVSGKTDRDAQVFAAGFLASVDSDGNFEVFIPVSEGEHNIEIKAVDAAGNQKVESRKITYHK